MVPGDQAIRDTRTTESRLRDSRTESGREWPRTSLRGEAKMHPPQASGKRREIDPLEVKRVCNIKHLIRGGERWRLARSTRRARICLSGSIRCNRPALGDDASVLAATQSQTAVPLKTDFETRARRRQRMPGKMSPLSGFQIQLPQTSGKTREFDPLEVKSVCTIKYVIRGGARSIRTIGSSRRIASCRGQNAEFERPRRGRGPLAKLGDECRNVGVGHGRMRPRASLARFGNSLGTFDRNAPASGLIGQHWAESDRWRNGRNGEGFRAPALCDVGTAPGAGARKPPKEETAGR